MATTHDGGYERGVAVTPDNNADLAQVARGLMATGSGNVVVILEGDTVAVTLSIVVGVPLRARVKRVLSTSTTATGIVALY